MNSKTKKLALLGMFSAFAYILTVITRIPISSVPFLQYDPKDFIIVILGFIMGPVPAMGVTAVVCLIEAVTISSTGLIGFVMNVISTASFACVASLIYKKKRTLGGAIFGLVIGVITMCGIMLLWNYLITPLYMSLDRDIIKSMLLPVFLPFNLIKGSINAALAMLLYKPVVKALKTTKLVEGVERKNDVKISVIAVCILVLASCVLGILIIKGII
ncbi:MAG: ECF transporter S component [Clostridia bacterium]|nr:ECF transporter S component [Clostridia bacterium]